MNAAAVLRQARRLPFALLLSGLCTAASALPFSNGSLESSAPGYIQSVGAFSSANGWSTGGANVEFVRSGYTNGSDTVGPAQDGEWFVDLNGSQGMGAIQQSFDTVPGQWYRIDYWMSGNAGPLGGTSNGGPKTLQVNWNGAMADTAAYAHLPGDNWFNLRWEPHSFLAQAIGSSSTLQFQSTFGFHAAAGALVDGISVTPVPEPGSALLLAGGLGLVLSLARRRRG